MKLSWAPLSFAHYFVAKHLFDVLTSSIFGQTTCPKPIRDVHLWGSKHQTNNIYNNTKTTILTYVFHAANHHIFLVL